MKEIYLQVYFFMAIISQAFYICPVRPIEMPDSELNYCLGEVRQVCVCEEYECKWIWICEGD